MSEFDIDAFVAELERLGLKLTATQLPDGTYRINRWRLPAAIANVAQIENLWNAQIGDDTSRMVLLAASLARRPLNRSSSDK